MQDTYLSLKSVIANFVKIIISDLYQTIEYKEEK